MKKNTYHVIGVMSGTSLDGLDLCYVRFDKEARWTFEILHTETLEYSALWESRLKHAIELPPEPLEQLDFEYAVYLSEAVKTYIDKQNFSVIDAICSHGHTVFHQPHHGITKQIGNQEVLATRTAIPVVCDFRVQDVQLGGQGAPLVPIGDRLLFGDFDYCLNLGGFANISYESANSKRIAFDICPANLVLNRYSQYMGHAYDNGGLLAQKGTLKKDLLEALNALDYYKKTPPKSLGLEWLLQTVYPLMDRYDYSALDMLRTFVEHMAMQIAVSVKSSEEIRVLVTGGGAYNAFLIERIQLHTNAKIVIPDPALIEFKEALIFGLLGVLKLRNETNCLASVTGASKDHSSGEIFYA